MDLTVWEILNGSAYAFWGILVFSVVATGVAIDRFVSQWKIMEQARALANDVRTKLSRGAIAEARSACESSRSQLAGVFLEGFGNLDKQNFRHVAAAVHRSRIRWQASLGQRLWLLATVGALSPFVGLFGTVVGIMKAFSKFKLSGGEGGIASVSGDISEALIVTAAGILVALGGVFLYNYFTQRGKGHVMELRLLTDEFLELLELEHAKRSTGA